MTRTFTSSNADEVQAQMVALSARKPSFIWTAYNDFGETTATARSCSPSRLPGTVVDSSVRGCYGYWQAGSFQDFPAGVLAAATKRGWAHD